MVGYGDFIKMHRIASGYKNQKIFAEKTGISTSTISRIEKEIQKPEVRTLQALAQYLETTSYVELMVVCGYWNEDELLEDLAADPRKATEIKETPASYEEEFLDGIDIDLSDEELLKKFDLKIDGQALTKTEAQGILAYIRTLRTMNKS